MVSLALSLPGGVTISSVSYTIHSNQATTPPADKTGTVNTSNSMATASVETSYPASTNDIVTMTATTSDGAPCSGTSPEFTVTSGGQALVGLTITCGLVTADGGSGSVRVNATFVDNSDICPVLNAWMVSPLTTGPTGSIDVSSAATDGNMTDAVTYKWTATPAPATDPFTNSAIAATQFNCPGTGNFALTITVDDHHMPTNCTAVRTINVACGLCGNGTVDPGEDCDSAVAFMNHTCDPNTCKNVGIVCGNGLVQTGEQCDDAAAFAANTCAGPTGATIQTSTGPQTIAACQTIPTVCGNGLKQGSEECDAGPTGSATCDTTCHIISACLACENAGTACLGTKVTATSAFGCAGLTGTAQTNCNALKLCLEQHPLCSNPANVSPASTDPTACFCGALDAASCAGATSTTIAGPCAGSYYAVYGKTTATSTNADRDSVLGDFFAKATATGMANNLYACDINKSCINVSPALCP